MPGQPPPSSPLLLVWVIEALANIQEINVTTLINIFKRSPKLTNEVGSNARERISFRILERLFGSDTRPTKPFRCAQNSQVSFDFSKRCEDVLRHVLEQMHDSDIWNESEKSKWNVQPFLAFKRSCLLKSELKHDKSLKQILTSLHLNQHETTIHDVNGDILVDQQENPCGDDEVCPDIPSEMARTETLNGVDEDDVHQNQSIESESESEPESSGDECYHKEMNDIAVKKEAFFSLNCKGKEVATYKKDANRCMKCNKSGELLICSSEGCSFVFHESCLILTSSFECDSMKRFYCPFCKYSRSVSDYWVVKKKAKLARNDLVSFSTPTLKVLPKKSSVPEQNTTSENNVTKGIKRAYPLRIHVAEDNDDVSCEENVITETNGDKQDSRNMEKECRLKVVKGVLPLTRIRNEVSNSDLCNESSECSGTQERNEGSSEQTSYAYRSLRTKINASLTGPRGRRLPVPWTQLEEETLKKFMENVLGDSSRNHDRVIPWSRMLQLGGSNFQKGRKPGDLKDKWRNMQKASRNLT